MGREQYMNPTMGVLLAMMCAVSARGQCPSADHDCCSTGGPGCSDQACCESVCTVDATCCEVAWDEACAQMTIALCEGRSPGCTPCSHSCYEVGDLGCNDVACCELVCFVDEFCCYVAWDQFCIAEAFETCFPCEPVCPPEATQENEPCGENLNNGCPSAPNGGPTGIFTSIACGETICGTLWYRNSVIDFDWYLFSVPRTSKSVTIEVSADFGAVYWLYEVSTCANPDFVDLVPNTACPGATTFVLPQGEYAIRMIDGYGFLSTCELSHYTLSVSCTCAGDINADGTVDGADLGLLLGAWDTEGGAADLNASGTVNGADLGLLLGAWGSCEGRP